MDIQELVAIVLVLGGGWALLMAVTPVGRAIAERIRSGAAGAGSEQALRQIQETQQAMLEELQGVRQDLLELQERVDFAERLLAQQREAGGLLETGKGMSNVEPGTSK